MPTQKVKVHRIKNYFRRNPHIPYIAPTIIVLGALVIIPTIFLYFISLTDYEMASDFRNIRIVWFENFIRIFSGEDIDFYNSVILSLKFTVIATSVEMLFGFILAYMMNRDFKGKAVVFSCMIIPITMTPSIAALIWKLLLNTEYGFINYILNLLVGVKITWLGESLSLMSVIMVDVWQWTPFVALILYSGLRSLPLESYESAKIDGANSFQILLKITLPLLKPIIMLALLFRLIDCLKLFDVPFVLTQGGPGNKTETLGMHIYRLGFAQTGWIGRAAATSIVLLVVISIISTVLIKKMRKEEVN